MYLQTMQKKRKQKRKKKKRNRAQTAAGSRRDARVDTVLSSRLHSGYSMEFPAAVETSINIISAYISES